MYKTAVVVAAVVLGIVARAPSQALALDHPGAGVERLRATCHAYTADPTTLATHVAALADSVRRRSDDGMHRRLGCMRALLFTWYPDLEMRAIDVKMLARSASGAFGEFEQALAVDPRDTLAADGIAALGFEMLDSQNFEYAVEYQDSLAAVIYGAVAAGITTPIVLRLCAEASLDVGDLATARFCSQRALGRGVDSTWHLIRTSWLAAMHDDSATAMALFDQALRAAHDSGSQGEFAARAVSLFLPQTVAPAAFASALWRRPDGERVAWLHQQAGAGRGGYIGALLHAENHPDFLSFALGHCGFSAMRNGGWFRRRGQFSCGPAVDEFGITAQTLKIWDPATGAPVGLLTLAVLRKRLARSAGSGPAPAEEQYRFEVDFRQWDWQTERWTDTLVGLSYPVVEAKKLSLLPEVIPIGIPAGVGSWTLTISQPGRSGRITNDEELPLVDAPVALSDLVLGLASQGLSWPVGAEQVMLAPYGYVRHDELTHLFFQIRSDSTVADTHTSISVHRIVGTHVVPEAAYSITFSSRLRPGVQSTQREIDLSRIGKGNCQLQVRVADARGQVLAERATNLYIQ